jgi:hypothetical protein
MIISPIIAVDLVGHGRTAERLPIRIMHRQYRDNVIKLEGIKVFIERCREADKVVLD